MNIGLDQVPTDVERAADLYASTRDPKDRGLSPYSASRLAFLAGAEWQRAQEEAIAADMLGEAMGENCICSDGPDGRMVAQHDCPTHGWTWYTGGEPSPRAQETTPAPAQQSGPFRPIVWHDGRSVIFEGIGDDERFFCEVAMDGRGLPEIAQRIAAALNLSHQLDTLRTALAKCAERFREYEGTYRAKVDNSDPANLTSPTNVEALRKATSNAAMAQMCEEALGGEVPPEPTSMTLSNGWTVRRNGVLYMGGGATLDLTSLNISLAPEPGRDPATLRACIDLAQRMEIGPEASGKAVRRDLIDEMTRYLSGNSPCPDGPPSGSGLPGSTGTDDATRAREAMMDAGADCYDPRAETFVDLAEALSVGPFTAGECELPGNGAGWGGGVFGGDGGPVCTVHPDDCVGGTRADAVRECERIAAALNAVDGMTCEHCHDLGHSHAPGCPLSTPTHVALHRPYRAEGTVVRTRSGLTVAICPAWAIGTLSHRKLGNMAQDIADALNGDREDLFDAGWRAGWDLRDSLAARKPWVKPEVRRLDTSANPVDSFVDYAFLSGFAHLLDPSKLAEAREHCAEPYDRQKVEMDMDSVISRDQAEAMARRYHRLDREELLREARGIEGQRAAEEAWNKPPFRPVDTASGRLAAHLAERAGALGMAGLRGLEVAAYPAGVDGSGFATIINLGDLAEAIIAEVTARQRLRP